jgi:eukaryotic-like serine/threonine-protein kinase
VPATLGEHDRYRVVSVLGTGGNATTYKCWDIESEQYVAVKALSLQTMKTWKQLELFEREARVLEQMNNPSIPRYLEYFEEDSETDKRFFIVQELADGRSLEQMRLQGHFWTDEELLHIVEELLITLLYLSSLRPPVVHRDIKPANIIVENPDNVISSKIMLVDFGGVQASEMKDFNSVTIVGTFDFMAPEQFRGRAGTGSDLYGVGATILYLATGRVPSQFPESRMKLDLSSVTMMNRTLKGVVSALLEPVPEDRLDAKQILDILRTRKSTGRIGGSRFQDIDTSLPSAPVRENPPNAVVTQKGFPVRKPVGSRVFLEEGEDHLRIAIPPAKFDTASISTGGFALFWNGFVAVWTAGALASGGILFALFSIPFWAAGISMAKAAIGRQFISEKMEIGCVAWTFERQLAILSRHVDGSQKPDFSQGSAKQATGYTRDLSQAQVVVQGYINGVPQTELCIKHGVEKIVFGEGLDPYEQEWIAYRVNAFLSNLQN